MLSLGLLVCFAGCSNEEQKDTIKIEEQYDSQRVYNDLSDNLVDLYNDCVKSTVKVTGIAASKKTLVGSGVVYKEEGNYAYILTNAHVITTKDGAEQYFVEINIVDMVQRVGNCMNRDLLDLSFYPYKKIR